MKTDFRTDGDFIEIMLYHVKEFEMVYEKIENLSFETVPHNSIDDFITVKENIAIIHSMLSGLHIEKYGTANGIKKAIEELPFKTSVQTIIEHHKAFAEDTKAMNLLISEL